MIFVNKTGNEKIQKACEIADDFLKNHLSVVKKEPHFSYTKLTSVGVYNQIKDFISEAKIEVVTYKPFWRWSKAIAYTDKTGKIYLNAYRISERSLLDYVNTLTHELCHRAGFGHGSNSPKGKEQSVNYRVGEIAEKWAVLVGKEI